MHTRTGAMASAIGERPSQGSGATRGRYRFGIVPVWLVGCPAVGPLRDSTDSVGVPGATGNSPIRCAGRGSACDLLHM